MIGQPRGMSLRDYAANRNSGGGGRMLKNWKKDGSIVVWPHPKAMVLTIYRHGFTRVEPREDRQTHVKTREVWFDPLRCLEDESVVQDQYFRDRDTGKRKNPPRVCPFCLMTEHLHQLIEDRVLDWRTPVFRFEGTDPSKTKVYHAGGITGHFNGKNLSDGKKQELLGNLPDGSPDPKWPVTKWFGPVYQKGPKAAFMEDLRASESVVFSVVNEADVRAGVVLTVEAKGLGSKFQDMMAKQIEGAKCPGDPDGLAGDLEAHPYAVKWTYDGDNPNPGDKYDSTAMTRIPLTPAVADLFRTPPPSLEKFAEGWNLKTIRARMEEHLVLPALRPHLDRYFAAAFEAERQEASRKAAAPAAPLVPEVGRPLPSDPGVTRQAPTPTAPPSDETFSCSLTQGCPGIMRAEDATCPVCHAVYVVDAEPPPPPAPAPRPRPRPAPQSQQVAAPPLTPGLAADQSMRGPDPLGLTPESQDLPAPDEGGTSGGGYSYPGDPDSDIPFARASFGPTEAWND